MATVLPDSPTSEPAADPGERRSRRDEIAIAFFGSWMLFGLFLDGWAHQAEKPETFFSPWHGVLYSGFGAALVWFAIDGYRSSGTPGRAAFVPADRLTAIGLWLFVAGALGDGVWHEIFGIEVDLEALLSPTHLLLLVGGFLMLTGPVRAARDDPGDDAPNLREFLPTVVTLTLATALVSFFTMYLSAFLGAGTYWVRGGGDVRELLEVVGIGAVLGTNLILLAPVVFVLRLWRPPVGTFTILFSTVAVAMTGLDAFDRAELAIAGILGGITADVLIRLRQRPVAITALVPVVTWTSYFVIVELSVGVEWAIELVAGSILLAAVSGMLLTTLTRCTTTPN